MKKESKLKLPRNPTLKDFQKYVADLVKERGFEKETMPQIFYALFGRVWRDG
mgnify:CR=1 FL=1